MICYHRLEGVGMRSATTIPINSGGEPWGLEDGDCLTQLEFHRRYKGLNRPSTGDSSRLLSPALQAGGVSLRRSFPHPNIPLPSIVYIDGPLVCIPSQVPG